MSTSTLTLRTALLASLLLAFVHDAAAAAVPPTAAAREARVVRLVDVDRLAAAGGATVVALFRAGSVLVHEFMVELVDSAGVASDQSLSWQATLVSGSDLTPLVRLTNGRPTLSLPQPLALRVTADSLRIEVRLDGGTAAGASLRVTVAYESANGPITRWAVLPVLPALLDGDAVGARSWEFAAEGNGRLMAVVGVSFRAAGELALEEVATGKVVWRERFSGTAAAGFMHTGDAIRVGAVIEAGVRYRLTATGCADEADVLAMVLPSRTQVERVAAAHD